MNYVTKRSSPCIGRSHAYCIVRAALACGKLIRPKLCSQCGFEGKIEAHHQDYSRPLDVSWLCKKCHAPLSKLAQVHKRRQGRYPPVPKRGHK